MPNSHTYLYVHAIFATKDRRNSIKPAVQTLHLLLSIHPQTALSDLMRQIKAKSSRWIHENIHGLSTFGWQEGYGAFTVSYSNVADVKRYIEDQVRHHRGMSSREEFVAFLQRHGAAVDANHVD